MSARTRSAGRALCHGGRTPGVHGTLIQEEGVHRSPATHRTAAATAAPDRVVQEPVTKAMVMACTVLRAVAAIGCATPRRFLCPRLTRHWHRHQGLARGDAWRWRRLLGRCRDCLGLGTLLGLDHPAAPHQGHHCRIRPGLSHVPTSDSRIQSTLPAPKIRHLPETPAGGSTPVRSVQSFLAGIIPKGRLPGRGCGNCPECRALG
jgi:hypothetical protein